MIYAKAWVLVQALLLISAMCGLEFSGFHDTLAVLCLGYSFFVYRRMSWASK